jgi:hypothetical protein
MADMRGKITAWKHLHTRFVRPASAICPSMRFAGDGKTGPSVIRSAAVVTPLRRGNGERLSDRGVFTNMLRELLMLAETEIASPD